MNFLQALEKAAPIVMKFVPNGDRFTPIIVAGMHVAEESTKKNKDKKELAKSVSQAVAAAINSKQGKVVIDPVKLNDVMDQDIDLIVDVANAMSKARAIEQAPPVMGIEGLFQTTEVK